MGKPKKGWFPPFAPTMYAVTIRGGRLVESNLTIAWGDSVYWINQDPVRYQIAPLGSDGKPDAKNVWVSVDRAGTDNSTSSPVEFPWTKKTPPTNQPQVFAYGLVEAPTAIGRIQVQIKV